MYRVFEVVLQPSTLGESGTQVYALFTFASAGRNFCKIVPLPQLTALALGPPEDNRPLRQFASAITTHVYIDLCV